MIVSLIGEDESGGVPSTDGLAGWADAYGLTTPVAADSSWGVSFRYEQDYGIPSQHLIAPGGEIIAVDSWVNDSDIEAILPD